MRIGFLSFEYPPGTSGGIGSYVYMAARGLARTGHEVTVICGKRRGQSISDERYPGVDVVRLEWEVTGRFWNLRPEMRNLQRIAQTVEELHRDRPFDVIEGTEYNGEAYQLLKNGFNCPIVAKLHTANDLVWEITSRQVRGRLRRLLAFYLTIYPRLGFLRLVLEKSNRLHAPSLAIARLTARRYGIDFDKIDHVPNLSIPSPVPPSFEHREPFTVLYVGRLAIIKGVELFAKIIPRVLERFPQSRFAFLGRDGAYGNHPSMKRWLISQLGPAAANCEFLGAVPYGEVQDHMRRASICVFPSLWETFPTVCLEAMDAGAVVVGSMRGGMAEMIEEGVSGFLGDPGNPETFADKIILALEDAKLRESMGQAARQRVFEKYRPEVIIPQQLAAYQRAIEQFHHTRKT